jgi:DNA adenine methylase
MQMYETLRRSPDDIGKALRSMPQGPEAYYGWRGKKPTSLNPVLQAARFIYLNRFCFNGLYRANREGAFNVPYGGTRVGDLPTTKDLVAFADLLHNATLRCGDFTETIKDAGPGDFVYLDPPYATQGSFRRGHHYTYDTFGTGDIARLDNVLLDLDRRGARFVVSYADSEEGRFLAKRYYCQSAEVRRSIAGFAGQRARSWELIISNQPPH